MCKTNQIKTLMLGPTRFGGRFTIYDEYEIIQDYKDDNSYIGNERTESELKNYLDKYDTLKTLKPFVSATKKSHYKKNIAAANKNRKNEQNDLVSKFLKLIVICTLNIILWRVWIQKINNKLFNLYLFF